MPAVLAILAEGFEEIEAITPIDLLRRAGASVTTASLGANQLVKGRSEIMIQCEASLANVDANSFDCLLLPGGPHVGRLRADHRVKEMVSAFYMRDKWVAAICAAPLLLHDAGLLCGRNYTAYPATGTELPNIQADQRVVTDGKLITSRGAGTSLDFGAELVRRLISAEAAAKVLASICA